MKSLNTFIFCLGLSFLSVAQSQEVYFMDYPTLTPDGKTIIFSFEGDLWKIPTSGGLATRITAMDGQETLAKVSPDGQWLAFSGNPYGNTDIFIMPLQGGNIRQLTYHEAGDELSSWTWDSKSLYFTSSRYNQMSAYQVSQTGGTPERLFGNYFNTVHKTVEHPLTGELFFSESWESSVFEHRKGYKGPFNPDVQSYNRKTQEFKTYTDYEGKDFDVTIDRAGNIYFVSDEFNGVYNLYTFRNGQKTRLTDFESPVKRPFVNADGGTIVFQKDYQLFTYDVASGKSQKVSVQIVRNPTLERIQDFKTDGEISAFKVSQDGKKLAFVSRGELFVSDTEGKFIKQLSTRPDGRVMEVNWLKDNKTLLFSQTVNGYQNWFTIAADGTGSEKQLTSDAQNNRNLTFNSEHTKAVYLSGRNEVRLMDLSNYTSTTLLKEELWGFYNDMPYFSPDDRYILFTAYRNFEKDIFVYDLQTKEKLNLTETGVTETEAVWSPDGKYIFFTSDQTNPSYPRGTQESKIYRMALQKYDAPYRSDKLTELFKEEEKKDKEEKKEGEKEKEEKKEKVKVVIDKEGLMKRLEIIGVRYGEQAAPFVVQKDDKTTILYLSNHDEGKTAIWKTTLEPFKEPETKKLEGGDAWGMDLQQVDDKLYALIGGNLHTVNLEQNKLEKVTISYTFRRKLQAEFEQMFYETWANLEENFYAEDLHGLDWQAMKKQYEVFLPYLNNRNDLRRLLNDMLGELNASHFGFYSNGKEERTFYTNYTLATGIEFDNKKPYVVSGIIKNTPADRMKDIKPGDELIAVNGQAVDVNMNREQYFIRPSLDEELTLTFRRNGKDIIVKLHPVSYTNVRDELYNQWIAENQKRVDEKSNNRIAYTYMKNMGDGELNEFLKEMVSEAYKREALILDLRYNTGGNVHDKVLQFLSQKPYLQWKYRGGEMTPQPNFSPAAKPIVLLINEQSLSDAEMTAEGFKQLGLGTIIGTPTYRWIIFTSGKGLVDGSFYRLPSWGCYTLDGKNLEKTGVEPDVYVKNTFTDRIMNNDPQLDRAIQDILQKLDKSTGQK